MPNYEIDYNGCYESFPCQHLVSIDGRQSCLLNGYNIIDIIIDNKIQCSYNDFKHFEYLFNKKEHFSYLEYLRNLKTNNKSQINFYDLHENIYDYMYKNPAMTVSHKNFPRSVVKHTRLLHKCFKNNDQFIYKPNQKHSLYLKEIICDNNIIPNKVELFIDNILIKTWYKDCCKNLKITENYGIYVKEEIKIVVENNDVIENVFIDLLLNEMEFKPYSISLNTTEILHTDNKRYFSIKLNDNNVYSKIFLVFDDLTNINTISLTLNDILILDTVPKNYLNLKDNILSYKFCELEYGENIKDLTFDIEGEFNEIKIYGIKQIFCKIGY